jgi:hypothetical protein
VAVARGNSVNGVTDLGNLGGTEWNTPMAIDLNALVAHGYTDTLTSAQDINDFGWPLRRRP